MADIGQENEGHLTKKDPVLDSDFTAVDAGIQKKSQGTTGGFTLDSIRVNPVEMPVVQKVLGQIGVGRPSLTNFFSVHPDPTYSIDTYLLIVGETGNEFYLPSPDLWVSLQSESSMKTRRLVTTVTPQGALGIWPLGLPDATGRLNSWTESALEIAEYAKGRWVRIKSNREIARYECFEAQGTLTEPSWPELSFEQMMNMAFRDRRIMSLDHPVLRRLRGEIV